MKWDDVSFVIGSRKREEIFLLLETPRTPTQLSKMAKISLSNIWIKLKALEERKLILCLTPKVRKGKIYSLTSEGKSTLIEVKKMLKKD
ncbi:MAG: hypothetical protein AABY04_02945 [Candidatus Micrarchaeota archaeon]